ncbi:MAG: hypothetical protein Q4B03_05295 [Lachnospiraceae bacterium]|nr:hypothetical protein [Lachnospiraceae bacterium]
MTLFDVVYSGNDTVSGLTEGAINDAIAKYGEDKAIAFPDTEFSLPCFYAVTGTRINTLGELKAGLETVKTLQGRGLRLGDVFNSGVATAIEAEFIEALKYIDGAQPYAAPYSGFISDATLQALAGPLTSGEIPGIAVILGKAPTAEDAAALVKSYRDQNILVTLVGDVIDQLVETGVQTGADVGVIPLGKDVTAVVHIVSVAVRAALVLGNIQPGDAAGLMDFTFKGIPAFVNALGTLDPVTVAAGAGAIALGFPVVTNDAETAAAVNIKVPKSLIVQPDFAKFNATSVEARNLKVS